MTRASADEQAFLRSYKKEVHPRPAVTVDIVVLTILDADLKVLLVRRKEHPFRGRWALPGGFVRVGDAAEDQGEDLDEAAARELEEETGLPRRAVFLEQLRAFGKPNRDPRTRVITIAYYALVRPDLAPLVAAGTDAAEAGWASVARGERRPLAFDHDAILDATLAHLSAALEHSRVAFELVPQAFTIPELRATYEILTGTRYDPGNFRRRFLRMVEDGLIEEAPGKRITASKPARVYRFRR